MSEEVKVFENESFGKVRTLTIDGVAWFVGKDVGEILGYKNIPDALKKHVDEEDKGVAKCDTLGGKQNLTIINESGFYCLVFGSKLEKSREFKKWITKEVIPKLRESAGLNQYEAFRMLDKEMQKKAMTTVFENGKMGGTDCIVANKKVNKITSEMYGFEKPLTKKIMEKEHKEMLKDRQEVMSDYETIFSIAKSHKLTETVVKNKYTENKIAN